MHIVSHIAITHNEWPNEHYKYMKTCAKTHENCSAFFRFLIYIFFLLLLLLIFFLWCSTAMQCVWLLLLLLFFVCSNFCITVCTESINSYLSHQQWGSIWIHCCVCRCSKLQTALFRPCLNTHSFVVDPFICLTFTRKRVIAPVFLCICSTVSVAFGVSIAWYAGVCVCVYVWHYVFVCWMCVNLNIPAYWNK